MFKLWQRSGGYYLFWTSFLYLAVGTYCIFVNNFVPVWIAQMAWITVLTLPLAIPPFGRWLNMSIDWDKNMFNWFKGKNKMSDSDKVIPFPEPKEVPKMPYVEPPAKPEPKTYYTFGLTDDNRVTFQMGYTTLTMNDAGVQQLINQLEFFKSQLADE